MNVDVSLIVCPREASCTHAQTGCTRVAMHAANITKTSMEKSKGADMPRRTKTETNRLTAACAAKADAHLRTKQVSNADRGITTSHATFAAACRLTMFQDMIELLRNE